MNINCFDTNAKCSNCGKHETAMCIAASEDGSMTKFLGYSPMKKDVKEPVETRTGVTIKRD